MNKLVLVSATTISLLMACGAGGNKGNIKSGCSDCTKTEKPIQAEQRDVKKISPFLIKRGLPHMTKLVKKNWDNPKIALTNTQKEKLLEVRQSVTKLVKRIEPEVIALQKEIIRASHSGTSSQALKEKVEKLASLETEATLGHLECIEQTKAILTPEQTMLLLSPVK